MPRSQDIWKLIKITVSLFKELSSFFLFLDIRDNVEGELEPSMTDVTIPLIFRSKWGPKRASTIVDEI